MRATEPNIVENGNTVRGPGGCDDTVGELFRRLYPSLRRHAAVAASPLDDPDDLVQEALERLLARTGATAVRNPEAYLRRAITNLAIDRGRRRSTRHDKRHLVAVDGESVDVYPSDLSALDQIGVLDRTILYLVDVEGRPFRDVAEMTGCTVTAARLRASRARRTLRDLLEEQT